MNAKGGVKLGAPFKFAGGVSLNNKKSGGKKTETIHFQFLLEVFIKYFDKASPVLDNL